jgi:hypothetical protein
VPAFFRRLVLLTRLGSMGTDGHRADGHNNRIAFARITVVVQLRGNLLPAIDGEVGTRRTQRLVFLLRVLFTLWVNQRSIRIEVGKIVALKLIQRDPFLSLPISSSTCFTAAVTCGESGPKSCPAWSTLE